MMASKLAFVVIAMSLGACHSEIQANQDSYPATGDDTATGTGTSESHQGRLELHTTSDQAAADTDNLTMKFGTIKIHVADQTAQDALGGEWVVMTDDAGTFSIIEKQPHDYLLVAGDVPAVTYDAVDVEILATTYVNGDGQVYDVSPPEELSSDLRIDTVFCVGPDKTTVLDSNLQAQLGSNSPSDWFFNIDATVDDHGSCPR